MKMKKLLAAALAAAMALSATVPVLAAEDAPDDAEHVWVDGLHSDTKVDTWTDYADTASNSDDYTIDTAGNVTIKTALGMAWFAKNVTTEKSYEDKTVTLEDSIDLSEHYWVSVGTQLVDGQVNNAPFKGTFDGGGNKITGLKQKTLYDSRIGETPGGLFACNSGTIHDVDIAGDVESTPQYINVDAGSVAAQSNGGTFQDCTSSVNITVVPNSTYCCVGGIVGGFKTSIIIENCEYSGTLTCNDASTPIYCGGIFGGGFNGGSGSITNCTNSGSIIGDSGYGRDSYIGGIAGSGDYLNISDCTNYGSINFKISGDTAYVGGIAGFYSLARDRKSITGCSNKGAIFVDGDCTDAWVGGIIGATAGTTVQNCTNSGNIKCSNTKGAGYAGGITGYAERNSTADDCTNSGDIECSSESEGHAGGIFGIFDSFVYDCTNTGDITVNAPSGFAGGIAGDTQYNKGGHIYDSTNSGDVTLGESTTTGYVGGIIGRQQEEGDKGSWFDLERNTNVGKVNVPNSGDIKKGYIAGETDARFIEDNSYVTWGQDISAFGELTEEGISLSDKDKETIEEETTTYESLAEYDEANRTDITVSLKTSLKGLEDITLAEESNPSKAYIVLSADKDKKIYRYMSSEFTFNISDENAEYVITPYGNNVLTDLGEVDASEGASHRYGFNLDGDPASISGENIIIGEIELVSVGSYTVKVVDGKVQTAKLFASAPDVDDNIVYTYSYDSNHITPDDKLHIGGVDGEGSGEWNLENKPADKKVTINVVFPNNVVAGSVDYTDMSVNISGGAGVDKTIDLGTDNDSSDATVEEKHFSYDADITQTDDGKANGYQILTTLPIPEGVGNRFTFTFSGKGYRTYSVDAVITGEEPEVPHIITVWNNAMDNKHVVTQSDSFDDVEREVTFLAGDIDNSQHIDLYDLSAAVAYFGTTNDTENVTEESKKYIQYDLNRDGAIDSKDIAMVLVSWGN